MTKPNMTKARMYSVKVKYGGGPVKVVRVRARSKQAAEASVRKWWRRHNA